jgi:hypothetical protein
MQDQHSDVFDPKAALAVAVALPYFHQYRFDTAFPTRAIGFVKYMLLCGSV